MVNSQQTKAIEEFFQVFIKSINKTFLGALDTDVCTNIQFIMNSTGKLDEVSSLKSGNVIYKLDYATGNRQGSFAVLVPEVMIANISDILTGGSGQDVYKGSLSEIETNSILTILEKTFKNIESDFKKQYEHDLVFSANSSLLLKEMPQYDSFLENLAFDFLISGTLNLMKENEYPINLLLSASRLENLMSDLGLTEESSVHRKSNISAVTVKNLADVKINVTAELGRTRVPIKYALELVRGSLIELDTLNNSDIKVFANGIEFARAQVVAVEDNFGLRITKIISPNDRFNMTEQAVPRFDINAAAVSNPLTSGAPKTQTKASAPAVKQSAEIDFHADVSAELAQIHIEDIALDFDKEQAQKVLINSVKMGKILKLPQKELSNLGQIAYYYNIGAKKSESSDLSTEFRRNKAAESANQLEKLGTVGKEISDTVKNCADYYESETFPLTAKIPYNHIVAITSYYEESISSGLSKQETLLKMLQLGGNQFNIFILHKFIKLMKESSD